MRPGGTQNNNNNNNNNGSTAPQRSERPKAVKSDKLDEDRNGGQDRDRPQGMAAPRAGGNGGQNNMRPAMNKKKNDDEDDFGDTDVSDLLG